MAKNRSRKLAIGLAIVAIAIAVLSPICSAKSWGSMTHEERQQFMEEHHQRLEEHQQRVDKDFARALQQMADGDRLMDQFAKDRQKSFDNTKRIVFGVCIALVGLYFLNIIVSRRKSRTVVIHDTSYRPRNNNNNGNKKKKNPNQNLNQNTKQNNGNNKNGKQNNPPRQNGGGKKRNNNPSQKQNKQSSNKGRESK